jgi:hypothetical protein
VKLPKLGELKETAETEVLAFMAFPKAHHTQIHSTNPLERLNAEIKRRTNVVGVFPNEAAVIRLAGALLLEQNDEWQLQRHYMQGERLQSFFGVSGQKGNVCPSLIPWASPSGHAARPGINSSRAAGADTRSLGLARYHRVIAR